MTSQDVGTTWVLQHQAAHTIERGPVTLSVEHAEFELRPDHSRTITRLFVAGREDVGGADSRGPEIIDRMMRLPDGAVEQALQLLEKRFAGRHRNLRDIFERHANLMRPGIVDDPTVSDARRLLMGAAFTHEYAIEGAALCNPSAVPYPPSQETDNGEGFYFVMSVRGIGEGHRSSVGFRSGVLHDDGTVVIDPPGPHPVTAIASSGRNYQSVYQAKLAELEDRSIATYILEALPSTFSDAELEARIEALAPEFASRRFAASTIAHLRGIAQAAYTVDFGADIEISERVLWPQSAPESHGIEDVRFVRFCAPNGEVTYYGTYTAFDGMHVAQHMIETSDFQKFAMSPVGGDAAVGKGLAFFPRQVGGRYVALSRWDRETNAVAYSDDLHSWEKAETIQVPEQPWEILQLGNCGSPIETEAGWLVLTHGVGPMRTYSLGAILLDLEEPHRLVSIARDPIICPEEGRREGYVPNVVYSCGGFADGDRLVVPYGIGDQSISVATLSIEELLNSMQAVRGERTNRSANR